MAKFNTYLIHAECNDGRVVIDKNISALGLEQAFHKAVAEAFEAKAQGDILETISVNRLSSPSEHHG